MFNKVFLEVNGKRYEGFTSLNFSKNIEELSGSFSFVASTEKKRYTPFRGQEECRILINNTPIITGYIENLTYSYDSGSHTIEVSGRDKTCDIIDNNVFGNIDFSCPIKIEDIITQVLSQVSLIDRTVVFKIPNLNLPTKRLYTPNSGIKVINNVTGLKEFELNELVVAEVGENMFDFLEKYCRKRGVILTSNGYGDVIITRAGESSMTGILLNQVNNNSNNIISASINYDYTSRYYKYICKSQGNISSSDYIEETEGTEEEGLGLADLSNTQSEALDNDIRQTRILEFENETSATSESNKFRADWEANIRRARSLIYRCSINKLFSDEKETDIYYPNKLILVQDDFCNINATMLIRSVEYNLSNEGTIVNLELVSKDAYSLQSSKDEFDARFNNVGYDYSEGEESE